MSETSMNAADLVSSALEKQPVTFRSAFDNVMLDKVYSAIESRKMDLAKSIFNNTAPEEEISSEVTVETQSGEVDGQDTQTDA